MPTATGGREAVARLAAEDPQWLPAVHAAVAVAEQARGEFAGARILAELRRQQAPRTWYPNFRRLVTFGILQRVGEPTHHGGHAYYRMPDIAGVRQGLREVERRQGAAATSPQLSFTGVGRSGRPDLSSSAESILRSSFPDA